MLCCLCSVDKRERFSCGCGSDTGCAFFSSFFFLSFFLTVLSNYPRVEVFTAVLINIPVVLDVTTRRLIFETTLKTETKKSPKQWYLPVYTESYSRRLKCWNVYIRMPFNDPGGRAF